MKPTRTPFDGADEEDESSFWSGLNQTELTQRFRNASEATFRLIEPKWDTSPTAKTKNDVKIEFLEQCKLYQTTPVHFKSIYTHQGDYSFEEIWQRSNERKLLRVMGLWMQGTKLPPAVFHWLDTGKLMRIDGHHRSAVALVSRHSPFLFYATEEVERYTFIRRVKLGQ